MKHTKNSVRFYVTDHAKERAIERLGEYPWSSKNYLSFFNGLEDYDHEKKVFTIIDPKKRIRYILDKKKNCLITLHRTNKTSIIKSNTVKMGKYFKEVSLTNHTKGNLRALVGRQWGDNKINDVLNESVYSGVYLNQLIYINEKEKLGFLLEPNKQIVNKVFPINGSRFNKVKSKILEQELIKF